MRNCRRSPDHRFNTRQRAVCHLSRLEEGECWVNFWVWWYEQIDVTTVLITISCVDTYTIWRLVLFFNLFVHMPTQDSLISKGLSEHRDYLSLAR